MGKRQPAWKGGGRLVLLLLLPAAVLVAALEGQLGITTWQAPGRRPIRCRPGGLARLVGPDSGPPHWRYGELGSPSCSTAGFDTSQEGGSEDSQNRGGGEAPHRAMAEIYEGGSSQVRAPKEAARVGYAKAQRRRGPGTRAGHPGRSDGTTYCLDAEHATGCLRGRHHDRPGLGKAGPGIRGDLCRRELPPTGYAVCRDEHCANATPSGWHSTCASQGPCTGELLCDTGSSWWCFHYPCWCRPCPSWRGTYGKWLHWNTLGPAHGIRWQPRARGAPYSGRSTWTLCGLTHAGSHTHDDLTDNGPSQTEPGTTKAVRQGTETSCRCNLPRDITGTEDHGQKSNGDYACCCGPGPCECSSVIGHCPEHYSTRCNARWGSSSLWHSQRWSSFGNSCSDWGAALPFRRRACSSCRSCEPRRRRQFGSGSCSLAPAASELLRTQEVYVGCWNLRGPFAVGSKGLMGPPLWNPFKQLPFGHSRTRLETPVSALRLCELSSCCVQISVQIPVHIAEGRLCLLPFKSPGYLLQQPACCLGFLRSGHHPWSPSFVVQLCRPWGPDNIPSWHSVSHRSALCLGASLRPSPCTGVTHGLSCCGTLVSADATQGEIGFVSSVPAMGITLAAPLQPVTAVDVSMRVSHQPLLQRSRSNCAIFGCTSCFPNPRPPLWFSSPLWGFFAWVSPCRGWSST